MGKKECVYMKMTKDSKKNKHIKVVGAIIAVALNTFVLGNLKNLDLNRYTKSKSSGVNLVLAASNIKCDINSSKKTTSSTKESAKHYDYVIKNTNDLDEFRENEKKRNNYKNMPEPQVRKMVLIDRTLLNDLIVGKKVAEAERMNANLKLRDAMDSLVQMIPQTTVNNTLKRMYPNTPFQVLLSPNILLLST